MQDGLAVEIPKESECDDRHTFEVNCCIWFVLTLPTLPCLRLHSGCVQLSPVHWSTETYHMECRDVNATHLQQEIDQYFVLTYASAGREPDRDKTTPEEIPLSKIARRQFIQLSAVAAAGCMVGSGKEARAADMPHLTEDDPTAQGLKYVDTSTTDGQTCANCALVQGADGDAMRPCQIFPGKLVSAAGWCSVWAPKA